MMDKGWRAKFNEVQGKIMDGYRRGVCNKNGESVKVNGRPIAKPRVMRQVTFHKVYPRYGEN